ncbi:hypothetical protein CYMTET_19765 [Cymbomonas tetramitiformis]|uniref:Uncharacterized protein n=1 Tax=Cymbomonas tetramitiformis TaxID=36881 RepID=A0AAE0G5C9_9CHLO|nr:hypothetical protein CYMTET_19765 [Cymbomonas tetramitiformis]
MALYRQVQNMHISESLCQAMGFSLTAMQMRIPVDALRDKVMQLRCQRKKSSRLPKPKGTPGLGRKPFRLHMRDELEILRSDGKASAEAADAVTVTAPGRSSSPLPGSDYALAASQPGARRQVGEHMLHLERLLGTTICVAYLEAMAIVRKVQIRSQVRRQRELDWETTNEGQGFEWFLALFRCMMTTLHLKHGWYFRCVLWNLVFLRNNDGSFDSSPALATVLGAGDTNPLLSSNPTGVLDVTLLEESIPPELIELFSKDGEADKWVKCLWATMCVVERCAGLDFGWVLNPASPPKERLTLMGTAEAFVEEQWVKAECSPELQARMWLAAKNAVGRWSAKRVDVLRALKKGQALRKAGEPALTPAEQRREWLQWMKDIGRAAAENHPWMKIAAVPCTDPYTRAQRILNECNCILLMLMCCLGFYYSRSATCCEGFRSAAGCGPEAGSDCHGFTQCAAVMDAFGCDAEFTCPPEEDRLPHGYTCSAFPQDTLMDKLYAAVYTVCIILPVNLTFKALFTAGGTFQAPQHWHRSKGKRMQDAASGYLKLWVENTIFIIFTIFFDQQRLSRSLSRYFIFFIRLLDALFKVFGRVVRAVYQKGMAVKQAIWFLYQTRVLRRKQEVVFEALLVAIKLEEERTQEQDKLLSQFDQARQEMDSLAQQFCYVLLVMCWGMITYVLLIYSMLIKELMGDAADKKVLQAWVITLLVDNLGMQVIKSVTIKLWLNALINKIHSMGKGEKALVRWFETSISHDLRTQYTSHQGFSDADDIMYDMASASF